MRHHIISPLIVVTDDGATVRSYFTVHSNNGPDHSGPFYDKLVRIDWQAQATLFRPMSTRAECL